MPSCQHPVSNHTRAAVHSLSWPPLVSAHHVDTFDRSQVHCSWQLRSLAPSDAAPDCSAPFRAAGSA